MRRIAIALTLLAGCFGEPDTVDKIVGTTVPMTTSAEESSSSSDGESSSGEDSSSSEAIDPNACPEWCSNGNGCDLLFGLYEKCRCISDLSCQDDLRCEGYKPDPFTVGHCQ